MIKMGKLKEIALIAAGMATVNLAVSWVLLSFLSSLIPELNTLAIGVGSIIMWVYSAILYGLTYAAARWLLNKFKILEW